MRLHPQEPPEHLKLISPTVASANLATQPGPSTRTDNALLACLSPRELLTPRPERKTATEQLTTEKPSPGPPQETGLSGDKMGGQKAKGSESSSKTHTERPKTSMVKHQRRDRRSSLGEVTAERQKLSSWRTMEGSWME